MLGSQLELCRPQFGYIVVLLPLIVILKVHKSLYFVTSLLLARNFLLASLFSFQGPIELLFLFSQFDLLIRISVSRDSNQQIIRSAFLEVVGPSGLEPPTSRLSVVRSSQLSYGPVSTHRRAPSKLNNVITFPKTLLTYRTLPINLGLLEVSLERR